MTLARRWRRWRPAAALAALAIALVAAPAPVAAATPSCSAVLFVPVEGAGAYMVEQPESTPGAIFCEPSLGSLEFSVAAAPAHGTLSALQANGLGGASFSYTPSPGFAGADSFTLSARNGADAPVAVHLDVSVRLASDDAPVCGAGLTAEDDGDAYLVESGASVPGSIDCFDDEGAELTFAVEDGPEHGTLSEIEPEGSGSASFTYTPSPGYEGDDAFSFVANDGTQDSAPAVVEVAVSAVADDPPRCTATLATTSDVGGAFEVEQGETVHGSVACVDEDGAALDFSATAQPGHGVLAPLAASGDGGVDVAYTPAPGYLGFDDFRIDVSDGVNPAVPVTVRVRVVAARDDPPTCTAELAAPSTGDAYRVKQGATVAGVLDCEDDEGSPLGYSIATPPQHGSATPVGEDGRFSYTAPGSYAAPDEFTLLASDGANDSQPIVLEVAVVAAVNEPPACQVALGVGAGSDGAYLVDRNTGVPGRIVCDDDGEDDLAMTVVAPPLHGSLSTLVPDGPASAEFTYTPASGYVGPDTFALAGDDGETGPQSAAAVIQVVAPGPDVPHCQARLNTADSAGGYEVESGETVSGTLTCFDADGAELSFSIARAPGHGTISGLEPATDGVARFAYTADGAWTGPDDFALVASNGLHSSNAVEVDVAAVPPVDDPPECSISLFSEKLPSGAYPAEEGEINPGVVVCVDDEGEPLTFSMLEGPQHGEITGLQSEGEYAFFDYDADPSHLGPDTFSVSAHDPGDGVDVVTLDLEVGPAVNTAPACTATLNAPLTGGTFRVGAGTSTAGEISCEDAEFDALAFSVVQSPSRGTLSALVGSGDSRSFTYTAASGQSGPDQFSLKANDGRANSEAVAVVLLVEAPNETPPADRPASPGMSAPPSVSAPAPASSPPMAKPRKCREGFKKKKVRGKARCVKKPKKHRAKRHRVA